MLKGTPSSVPPSPGSGLGETISASVQAIHRDRNMVGNRYKNFFMGFIFLSLFNYNGISP